MMDIYKKDNNCYVPFNDKLLCIGDEEAVEKASVEEILEMVAQALVLAQYYQITSGRQQVRH